MLRIPGMGLVVSFPRAIQMMYEGLVLEWQLDQYRMHHGVMLMRTGDYKWQEVAVSEEMKSSYWLLSI